MVTCRADVVRVRNVQTELRRQSVCGNVSSRCCWDEKCSDRVEKTIGTHFVFSNFFVYEKMWTNMLGPDISQTAI